MKKHSRKERKLQKKRERQRQGNSKPCAVASQGTFIGQPLTGMVTKKLHVFTPTELTCDVFSLAYSNQDAKSVSQLIFKPQAVKQLQRHIDWGRPTSKNAVEQQGILLGSVYRTPSGYSGVVEAVLLSDAIGDRVYVESAHSEWSKMDRQMDELNQTRKHKLVKLGWWHTHPNMSIFMSGTDRETQSNYFYKDWQFAVVLNPQAKKWGVFIGEQAEPCAGCFLNQNVFKLGKTEELANKKGGVKNDRNK